ncbi:hypothetical protein FKG94_05170 [Exilibacterium tricleocarpae]|uniref:Uncharacterized protein n=1 Tax=Exilibacterium tricleocarpae TaxID=2591008 RepID=A0A545U3L4_9GAMM|nr:hypothetical protein [Exilibacterium tricleocarpae]TQV84058.1 hypothetical protein FKG94_05170 [Exilibacterium tricleocarpae]
MTQIQQHQLIKSLSHEIGAQIPLVDGAAVIKFNDDEELWLEVPKNGKLLILHTAICPISSLGVNCKRLESVLELNSSLDVLKCGWLGFHTLTNTLRYFMALPVDLTTADVLIGIMKDCKDIKKNIDEILVL